METVLHFARMVTLKNRKEPISKTEDSLAVLFKQRLYNFKPLFDCVKKLLPRQKMSVNSKRVSMVKWFIVVTFSIIFVYLIWTLFPPLPLRSLSLYVMFRVSIRLTVKFVFIRLVGPNNVTIFLARMRFFSTSFNLTDFTSRLQKNIKRSAATRKCQTC